MHLTRLMWISVQEETSFLQHGAVNQTWRPCSCRLKKLTAWSQFCHIDIEINMAYKTEALNYSSSRDSSDINQVQEVMLMLVHVMHAVLRRKLLMLSASV